jgi:chorismate-pyruvate lyase
VKPARYRITVRGRLTRRLVSAFEELDVEPVAEQTVLLAEIRDQAHLHGVLNLVRELGLELVSVQRSG